MRKVIKTLTPEELTRRLRMLGMTIGVIKVKAAIDQGLFPFAHRIQMSQSEYLIFEKEFEAWVEEYAVEEEEYPGWDGYVQRMKAEAQMREAAERLEQDQPA